MLSFVCICLMKFIEQDTSVRSRNILYDFYRAAREGTIYLHNLSWYLPMIIDGVKAQPGHVFYYIGSILLITNYH